MRMQNRGIDGPAVLFCLRIIIRNLNCKEELKLRQLVGSYGIVGIANE